MVLLMLLFMMKNTNRECAPKVARENAKKLNWKKSSKTLKVTDNAGSESSFFQSRICIVNME